MPAENLMTERDEKDKALAEMTAHLLEKQAALAAQSAALEAAEAWLTSYGYDLHDQLNRHPLADVFDAARASMKEKA